VKTRVCGKPPWAKIHSRAREGLVVGAHADAAQRRVALDRAVDVALRRVVVAFPGAVGALRSEQRGDEIAFPRMLDAEEVHGEQPFGFHARARLEHTHPEALGLLVAV
jgi:hypothetical protein